MKAQRLMKIVLLWFCLVGFPIAGFWLGGRWVEGQNIVKEHGAISRFAQLTLALEMYHDDYGVFPPTKYQPNPEGPVHSWRVLLAAYVGGRESNGKYDFTQEWNSPHNLQAFGRMPHMYETFPPWGTESLGDGKFAHYLAIGNDDDWLFSYPLKSRLVKKGNDRFLLVEYPDSQIHWMEPKY